MKFIDLHCDTLMLTIGRGVDNLYELPGAILDVRRMHSAGGLAQFFAIFMLPPDRPPSDFGLDGPVSDSDYIEYLLRAFYTTVENYGDFVAPAFSLADLLANERAGKLSGFLTFEDGRPIDGKLDNLKKYYDRGIRLISLTWNGENCFGYPNSRDAEVMQRGLKKFGLEAVEYMNELGIIVDVSHLSDGGFMDVARVSKKPFVASHSNCRSLCPHTRNLTDEMIKILADSGGMAGINFGPQFLNRDITVKESTTALMSEHIRHMINIGGAECVGLGSDNDGTSGNFEMDSIDKMHMLFDRLHNDGVSDDVIEKIAYKNALRVIGDIIG